MMLQEVLYPSQRKIALMVKLDESSIELGFYK